MQVFIASNHWSAWRTSNLCYTIHFGFSPGPLPDILLFLVSWRSCSFGDVSLIPSYVPTVHRWHACWSGRTQGPSSGPGSEQGRSTCQLSDCHHQREHSSTAPTSSPKAIVVNKELGPFAWASCPGVSSPTCSSPSAVLGEGQGPLSCSCTPEASCPICSGIKLGGHLSLTWAAPWHMGVGKVSSAAVMLSGLAHLCSLQQSQLYFAAQGRFRASSPECWGWWGSGQLSHCNEFRTSSPLCHRLQGVQEEGENLSLNHPTL